MNSPQHRFDEAEIRGLAKRLHSEVPLEALDPRRTAWCSDDDLNPHLLPTSPLPAVPAAVLVPLVTGSDELAVLLTERTEHLPTHAGQVAFPGGKIDEGDAGPVATALRETQEETGLDARFVEPIGFLDAYQTRTGFRVIPVVGLVRPGFSLRPEPGEVADIFQVPLRFLMDPRNHLTHTRTWQGVERAYYAMPYGKRYIWGVTAGMIKNMQRRLYSR